MTLLLCLLGGIWSLFCFAVGVYASLDMIEENEEVEEEYTLRRIK